MSALVTPLIHVLGSILDQVILEMDVSTCATIAPLFTVINLVSPEAWAQFGGGRWRGHAPGDRLYFVPPPALFDSDLIEKFCRSPPGPD